MIHEGFYTLNERFLEWRCVICGEVIDDEILENRQGLKVYQIIRMRNRKGTGRLI